MSPSLAGASPRGRAHLVATVVCVSLLAACFPSDPGPESPDVALAMDADGHLLVLGNLCGGARLKAVGIGSGGVRGVDLERTYTPADPAVLHFELVLAEPQPAFTLSSGDPARIPEAPLWVMVELEDGVWADASFDTLPRSGQAISVPYGEVGAEKIVQPIGDYPTRSPDCAPPAGDR